MPLPNPNILKVPQGLILTLFKLKEPGRELCSFGRRSQQGLSGTNDNLPARIISFYAAIFIFFRSVDIINSLPSLTMAKITLSNFLEMAIIAFIGFIPLDKSLM